MLLSPKIRQNERHKVVFIKIFELYSYSKATEVKKVWRFTGRLLLVVIIFVVALEVLLGIVFSVKDRHIEPMAVHDHPYLYYLFDEGEDNNIHGFKTHYPMEKQTNAYRIILMGGSVARGNAPEATIAAYLEDTLNLHTPGTKVQVINAGISGYVVQQEFILTQMLLQHYQPDMIIALDGYNDLLTFKLNRSTGSSYPLPPHHYKDFKVIQHNRREHHWRTRLSYTDRALNYLERQAEEKSYDWSAIDAAQKDNFVHTYWQVVEDTRDFCYIKGIAYHHFLQPVRYLKTPETDEEKALSALYLNLCKAEQQPYITDLSTVFSNKQDVFTDDCHLKSIGHRLLANHMAEVLFTRMDSTLLQ